MTGTERRDTDPATIDLGSVGDRAVEISTRFHPLRAIRFALSYSNERPRTLRMRLCAEDCLRPWKDCALNTEDPLMNVDTRSLRPELPGPTFLR